MLVEVLGTGILNRVDLSASPALQTIFDSLAKYDIYQNSNCTQWQAESSLSRKDDSMKTRRQQDDIDNVGSTRSTMQQLKVQCAVE